MTSLIGVVFRSDKMKDPLDSSTVDGVPKKLGRPCLGLEKLTHQESHIRTRKKRCAISVMIPNELMAAIDGLLLSKGMNKTKWVTSLIEAAIEKEGEA